MANSIVSLEAMTTTDIEVTGLNVPNDGVEIDQSEHEAHQVEKALEPSWQEEQKTKLEQILSTRRRSERLETPEESYDRVAGTDPTLRRRRKSNRDTREPAKGKKRSSIKDQEDIRGRQGTERTSTRCRSRTLSPAKNAKHDDTGNRDSSSNYHDSDRDNHISTRDSSPDAKISLSLRDAPNPDTSCGGSSARKVHQDGVRKGIIKNSRTQHLPVNLSRAEGGDLDESLSIQELSRAGIAGSSTNGRKIRANGNSSTKLSRDRDMAEIHSKQEASPLIFLPGTVARRTLWNAQGSSNSSWLESTKQNDQERQQGWKDSISGRTNGSGSKHRNSRSRSLSPSQSGRSHGRIANQVEKRHHESDREASICIDRARSRRSLVSHRDIERPRSRSQRPGLSRSRSFIECSGDNDGGRHRRQLSRAKSLRRLDVPSTSRDIESLPHLDKCAPRDEHQRNKGTSGKKNPSRNRNSTSKRAKSFRISKDESRGHIEQPKVDRLRRASSTKIDSDDMSRILASIMGSQDEITIDSQVLRRLCWQMAKLEDFGLNPMTESEKSVGSHSSSRNRETLPTKKAKSGDQTKVQHVIDLRNSWKETESQVTKVTLPTFGSKAA